MKLTKILALTLAMLFVLASCSSSSGSSNSDAGNATNDSSNSNGQEISKDDPMYVYYEDSELIWPDTQLDAQSIYNRIEYTTQMFYGDYAAYDSAYAGSEDEKEVAAFCEGVDYMDMLCNDGDTRSVTSLPYRIQAGAGCLNHKINSVADNWMRMYFYTQAGDLYSILGAYQINGNTLSFRQLTSYQYDESTDEITYTLADQSIDYNFAFQGWKLNLTKDGKTVELQARAARDTFLSVENYASTGSEILDGIGYINLLNNGEKEYTRIILDDENGESIYTAAAYFAEDGVLTISWIDGQGATHSHQLVYFICDNDGLVLTDGTTNYYYNDSSFVHYQNILGNNLSAEDKARLQNLTESRMEELAQKRTSLFADLSAAFEQAGLNITVDDVTGEIALDSAVLFDFDSAELSSEGKQFLEQFLKVYADVVFNEEYTGFVSKIMVEGHTDPQGTYESNLVLSQDRANAVMNWCSSADNGLTAQQTASITPLMEAVGYSYDYLIYDESGNVDNAASRRVAFRFLINLD